MDHSSFADNSVTRRLVRAKKPRSRAMSMKTFYINEDADTETPPAEHDGCQFFVPKIGSGPKTTHGPWIHPDPCGHGSHKITLSHLSSLGPEDCMWSFKIDAQDGAHNIDRVTVSVYCDLGDSNPSVAHNRSVPFEVFPVPGDFAAGWNSYVMFNIYRRCPHSSGFTYAPME